jgi:hypothetical protein
MYREVGEAGSVLRSGRRFIVMNATLQGPQLVSLLNVSLLTFIAQR